MSAAEISCSECNKRINIETDDKQTLDLLSDLWFDHHIDKECEA